MTIEFLHGNIFESKCQAIINPVNCEGKMGKGLAYQFKKKFPEMEKEYIQTCKKGELYPGKLHFYQEKEFLIINFPTKNKWREKSRIEYISKGLKILKKKIVEKKIKSIALPAVGGGNGGLNWNDVKFIIKKELSELTNVYIKVYEPSKNVKINRVEPKVNFDILILSYICMKLKEVTSINIVSTFELLSILTNRYFQNSNLKSNFDILKKYKEFYDLKNYGEIYELIRSKIISSEIENKMKYMRNVDFVIDLVNSYQNYINKIIHSLYKIEKGNNHYSKISEEVINILLSKNLININIFGEIEINYFKKT